MAIGAKIIFNDQGSAYKQKNPDPPQADQGFNLFSNFYRLFT